MNIRQHLLAVPQIEYWVAVLDYGPKLGIGPSLLSCSPEATRADIVAEVREHIASDRCVVHVKHVAGTDFEDVTFEIVNEALAMLEPEVIDHQAVRFDHAYDVRKHAI